MLAFPTPYLNATSLSGRRVVGSAFHHLKLTATTRSGTGGDLHDLLRGRRTVTDTLLLRIACLWGARKTQLLVPWLRGALVWRANLFCRINDAAKGNDAEQAGQLRRIRSMDKGNGAGSACSRRRSSTWLRRSTLKC